MSLGYPYTANESSGVVNELCINFSVIYHFEFHNQLLIVFLRDLHLGFLDLIFLRYDFSYKHWIDLILMAERSLNKHRNVMIKSFLFLISWY